MIVIDDLVEGDVLRNTASLTRYVVVGTDGEVVAVSEVFVSNPHEWEVVHPSSEGTRDRAARIKKAIA